MSQSFASRPYPGLYVFRENKIALVCSKAFYISPVRPRKIVSVRRRVYYFAKLMQLNTFSHTSVKIKEKKSNFGTL